MITGGEFPLNSMDDPNRSLPLASERTGLKKRELSSPKPSTPPKKRKKKKAKPFYIFLTPFFAQIVAIFTPVLLDFPSGLFETVQIVMAILPLFIRELASRENPKQVPTSREREDGLEKTSILKTPTLENTNFGKGTPNLLPISCRGVPNSPRIFIPCAASPFTPFSLPIR